jgi:hypothetical protein
MHLLNTKTNELKDFIGSTPPYAILSHTWGDDEVTFQDILQSAVGGKRLIEATAGYAKIQRCCEVALADGFKWVWIDTCCIDKSSSAELSEAINSMYMWYSKADVCYVYLSDANVAEYRGLWETGKWVKLRWEQSRWFTRGWTLQELIAPSSMIFFDGDWQEVGTKLSLHETISKITGIPSNILLGECRLTHCSVAQRMSWAARRETTRPEDLAYCLLGLFSVSMPLLYGEGLGKAFIRLQHEIIRNEEDPTIFAWKSEAGSTTIHASGLLAIFPSAFYNSGDIHGLPKDATVEYPSITVTTRGIILKTEITDSSPAIAAVGIRHIEEKVLIVGVPMGMYARGNCDIGDSEQRVNKRAEGTDGAAIDKVWRGTRIRNSRLAVVREHTSFNIFRPSHIHSVFVEQGVQGLFPLPDMYEETAYTIRGLDTDGKDLKIAAIYPESWAAGLRVFDESTFGIVRLAPAHDDSFDVVVREGYISQRSRLHCHRSPRLPSGSHILRTRLPSSFGKHAE